MNSLWKFFTSLRLTVTLLALGLVLVFFGTLAQVHDGLWDSLERWFQSFLVVRRAGDPWWVPPVFPGGYLIGWLLLINLIAAHIKRFQWSNKKIGIHLTHAGIILLLVGQLLTDMLSVESHLRLREGETKSYSEAHRDNELVFAIDAGNGQEKVVSIPEESVAKKGEITHPELPFSIRVKEYAANGEVVSLAPAQEAAGNLTSALATLDSQFSTVEGIVPQAERALQTPGRVEVWRAALKAAGEADTTDLVAAAKRVAADPARESKLREVLKARFRNEMVSRFATMAAGTQKAFTAENIAMRFVGRLEMEGKKVAEFLVPAATQGVGPRVTVNRLPETKSMDSRNIPFATLEVVSKGGQSLGTWFVSPWLDSQDVTVDGKTYRAALRAERYYHPFSVTLLKTTHEVYRGTEIPKNFQSRVRINNPQTAEAREVDIYMNNPLRYAGLAFYQYQMGRDEQYEVGTSTLQVVRNPSWLAPYLGCIIVGVGMTWQFMYHMVGFMRKRRNNPDQAPGKKQKSRKKHESLAKA